MYTILLVEDEPPILRYNKRVIKRCSDIFVVTDTASNGKEALKCMEARCPDVVITDVRMSVMDGLDLIARIRQEYPEVFTVVLSGHQDFEYVRESMLGGSVDYLLKPLKVHKLSELFERLGKRLEERRQNEISDMLRRLLTGGADRRIIEERLPDQWGMALLRAGSMPGSSAINSEAVFTDDVTPRKDIIHLEARDIHERLLLFHTEKEDIREILSSYQLVGYRTAVYCSPVRTDRLVETYRILCEEVDRRVCIGLDTVEPLDYRPEKSFTSVDEVLARHVVSLIKNHRYQQLKPELVSLFEKWERERAPQHWLDRSLKSILVLIDGSMVRFREDFLYRTQRQISEGFSYAKGYGDILYHFWSVIENEFDPSVKERESTQQIFDDVRSYLRMNLDQPLTLYGVAESFSISQTYLSRLFRRYEGTSFNEYMTNLKIQEAVSLIRQHPDIMLKDIAEQLGYNDSNYFSKVFKSVIGESPSHFMRNNKQ